MRDPKRELLALIAEYTTATVEYAYAQTEATIERRKRALEALKDFVNKAGITTP